MPDPILSIGDLEPERPTVAINRRSPDGWWQRLKERHFNVLLRWLPVRYVRRRDLYALRLPTEFGMRDLSRIGAAQREVAQIQGGEADEGAERRMERVLREVSGLVLEAPADVLDDLTPSQHIQILMAFAATAMGQTPTSQKPEPPENPSTSDASSPASTVSTAPGIG